ncbi:discoidin domain-containing protein [Actinoplanes sp. NBRC 101535]|uniref:discoidin domain-containing protein n=1 Tax=Actinoplanes sp. NBRC 101535 TaxID=3032196 RepID=UPI002555C847|nr:discoidin domain-containing protein [Actinoplanes sp. NBRC 101535]
MPARPAPRTGGPVPHERPAGLGGFGTVTPGVPHEEPAQDAAQATGPRRTGWLIGGGVALAVALTAGTTAFVYETMPAASTTVTPGTSGAAPVEYPAFETPSAAGTASSPSPAASASATTSISASVTVSPSESPTSAAPSATKAAAPAGKKNPSGTNLALNATTTASGTEGDPWRAINATDGDPSTRWSSAFTDPQWLKVDLGQRWELSEVTLMWENAHGVRYRVDTSVDGKTWKTLWSTTAGKGGTVSVAGKRTVARYVRMYGTERSNQYGYSLFEFQIR